jgi:hypothetical protein
MRLTQVVLRSCLRKQVAGAGVVCSSCCLFQSLSVPVVVCSGFCRRPRDEVSIIRRGGERPSLLMLSQYRSLSAVL